MARRIELTTYDWVRLRDFELIAAGADPADRIRFTGHRRALPVAYLASIGSWGALEVHQLVNDVEPHSALLPVSEAACRRFKARHQLLGRAQFARLHGPHPWARAEVSYLAYDAAQRAFGDHGAQGPLGVAVDYARACAASSRRGRILGLLPVEVLCWVRSFDALLTDHSLSIADWTGFTNDEKAWVWELGGPGGRPWGIDCFLHGPAVRALPNSDLAEAS